MASRRVVLAGLGLAGFVAAGAGWWRVDRSPDSARRPWQIAGPPSADVRIDAFCHAILAPNPHNRQPWTIKLVGADTALIGCDLDRRLPATDPFDRQITIGFGTFIEIASIAAAERGFDLDVIPFPDGESHPRLDGRAVARLTFRRARMQTRDPLFAAIRARRTNRLIYAARPPTAAQLAAVVRESVSVSTDTVVIDRLRPLVIGAITAEMKTPPAWMETVDLMRIGARDIDATPDGLILEGPMIETMSAAGLVSAETLADPSSIAFKTGLDEVGATFGSLPSIVWIATPGNTRADQIDAGRRYARAALRATTLGLVMHPMSQALQEYAAMVPFLAPVRQVLGVQGDERLQMLARLGTADAVAPSPRWPLETHLI
jgi:Nitroreductase family